MSKGGKREGAGRKKAVKEESFFLHVEIPVRYRKILTKPYSVCIRNILDKVQKEYEEID